MTNTWHPKKKRIFLNRLLIVISSRLSRFVSVCHNTHLLLGTLYTTQPCYPSSVLRSCQVHLLHNDHQLQLYPSRPHALSVVVRCNGQRAHAVYAVNSRDLSEHPQTDKCQYMLFLEIYQNKHHKYACCQKFYWAESPQYQDTSCTYRNM